MKVLRVTMPDGSKWDVPLRLIARDQAAYYKTTIDEELKNENALLDWAPNNMDWSDVAEWAKRVDGATINYQDGWVNGDKEIVETESWL